MISLTYLGVQYTTTGVYYLKEIIMKLLVSIIFILVSLTGYTQELTADSVAVYDWTGELMKLVFAFLGTILSWATYKGLPLLNAWLKSVMHFRGSAVVTDCVTEELALLSPDLVEALKDGKLSVDERKTLKDKILYRAETKLKKLAGFTKVNLTAWVEDRISVELGKLLSRI